MVGILQSLSTFTVQKKRLEIPRIIKSPDLHFPSRTWIAELYIPTYIFLMQKEKHYLITKAWKGCRLVLLRRLAHLRRLKYWKKDSNGRSLKLPRLLERNATKWERSSMFVRSAFFMVWNWTHDCSDWNFADWHVNSLGHVFSDEAKLGFLLVSIFTQATSKHRAVWDFFYPF